MKHLKLFEKFGITEAVIMPEPLDSTNIRDGYLKYQDLVRLGELNNFDVVNYKEFFNSLSEEDKLTAPPDDPRQPFFALFNVQTKKPMFVVKDKKKFMIPKFVVEDIISHELVHKGQVTRRSAGSNYRLPNPIDKYEYFSNKEEIMAFSYTIASELRARYGRYERALDDLSSGKFQSQLWHDIRWHVDRKTLNRYRKYIFSYLRKMFGVDEED